MICLFNLPANVAAEFYKYVDKEGRVHFVDEFYKIPEEYRHMGSMDFAILLTEKAEVAVAPGIGFGDLGDNYVRIAMVENEHRLRQAIRNIRRTLTDLTPSEEGAE